MLNLISDILDLSKIESGTVSVQAEEVFFSSLLEMIARPFRHEAENRRLTFEAFVDPALSQSLVTDAKRLQQVLKNLLSNAFKFTEQGQVRLSVLKGAAGPRVILFSTNPNRSLRLKLLTPALAFLPKRSASSSKPSNKQMPAPAANMAAPVWASQSAANWPACLAVKSSCAAPLVPAAPSLFICRKCMRAQHQRFQCTVHRSPPRCRQCPSLPRFIERSAWQTIAKRCSPAATSCSSWKTTRITRVSFAILLATPDLKCWSPVVAPRRSLFCANSTRRPCVSIFFFRTCWPGRFSTI